MDRAARGSTAHVSSSGARFAYVSARPYSAPATSSTSEPSSEGVSLSDSAVERLQEIQKETPNEPVYLRLLIEGGGCSGYQYEFSLEKSVEKGDRCDDRWV